MTVVAKQPATRTQPNLQPQPRKEIRTFPVQFRMADEEGSRRVEGYAAVFDSPSGDLGFREIIKPGAFDNALKNSDVRALFNHDPNFLLARTKSGTLKLEIDDKGLRYAFEAPNTRAGDDLLEMLRRGDLAESSFAFSIDWRNNEDVEQWDYDGASDTWTRTIFEVEELFDVAPVTYPAYKDTSVALRSLERAKKQQKPISTYRRDLAARELSIL